MDQSIRKEESLVDTLYLTLLVMTVAFAMGVIVYGGMDSVMPWAHDTFHEFRHAIGIPCH
ncbi:MAG: CbtB-domain containing protein [Nitrospinae bacterium]|nr:CbtB-domain containing protein [Nitrospinota bacterium]